MPRRTISSKIVSALPTARLQEVQQRERVLRRLQPDKSGFIVCGAEKVSARGGNDAERSLGANEHVAEVIAGIVFFEFAEAMQDAPVGEPTSSPSTRSRATP